VVDADDGHAMPPLGSAGARVWRGGRRCAGASVDEIRAKREAATKGNKCKVAGVAGGGAGAGAGAAHVGGDGEEEVEEEEEVIVRDTPPSSRAPRPLAPETENLVRWKAVAVVGMLERRLGEEGMRKVLRRLASLQGKALGAESLQEAATAATKATKAAREKAATAAAAAKTEGADEGANIAAKERAAAAAREERQRECDEAAAYHALAASPARFLRRYLRG